MAIMSKIYLQVKDVLDNNIDPIDDKISEEYLAGDEDTISVVRETYISEFEKASSLIKDFLKQKDYQKILDLVHRIKGVSLYIGSKILYDISSYICDCIRKNIPCDLEIEMITSLNDIVLQKLEERIS